MTICYLGLGSNLHNPRLQLKQALKALAKLPKSSIIQVSNLYYSRPLGLSAQPNFYNLVVQLRSLLPPEQLLRHCLAIECRQRRIRKKRWGPRTLDIDILLYGHEEINQPDLVIPHKQICNRDFVLYPLLEISPQLQLPNGKALSKFTKSCENHLITINQGHVLLSYMEIRANH